VKPGASVIALAGRRIDAPGAAFPRFPLEAVDRVAADVWKVIAAAGAGACVSSAACGADLIGLRIARQLGLRCEIMLPFEPARFRETSVADRPGDWGPLFDSIVRSLEPGQLHVLGTEPAHGAYERTSTAILDRAVELAGSPRDVLAIVIWDGASRGRGDVTAAFRDDAADRHLRIVEVLTPPTG